MNISAISMTLSNKHDLESKDILRVLREITQTPNCEAPLGCNLDRGVVPTAGERRNKRYKGSRQIETGCKLKRMRG
jgi:hypothetical protein